MRYRELKKLTFEEWDGKPFEAVVWDNDLNNFKVDKLDIDSMDDGGDTLRNIIVGWTNINGKGMWIEDSGAKWDNAHRIVIKKKGKK